MKNQRYRGVVISFHARNDLNVLIIHLSFIMQFFSALASLVISFQLQKCLSQNFLLNWQKLTQNLIKFDQKRTRYGQIQSRFAKKSRKLGNSQQLQIAAGNIPKPPSCAPSHFCWEMLSLMNNTIQKLNGQSFINRYKQNLENTLLTTRQ
ncbi:Hypothetical_protein [Hexamita inflata]|uniref:Hypothetical_protein n=1 Tax=Hexamita inflata TaxID=28002 RepID=A0AA86NR90_9EUKA|nr:Hypothetical protein HINF_LOCUS11015 [Hexamita inflata]